MQFGFPMPTRSAGTSSFYLITGADREKHSLAAAGPELCVLISGAAEFFGKTGAAQCLTQGTLIGPRFQSTQMRLDRTAQALILRLTPADWWAVTQCPAGDFRDKILDAEWLIRPILDRAARPVCARTLAQQIQTHVSALARTAGTRNNWLIQAVTTWLAASPDPQLADLLSATGLSPAQAQRQVKSLFGAPPKLLARRHRALAAADRLSAGQSDWRDDLGVIFYDQSHYIREIKHFTGLTPGQIRAGCSWAGRNSAKDQG